MGSKLEEAREAARRRRTPVHISGKHHHPPSSTLLDSDVFVSFITVTFAVFFYVFSEISHRI
jgi:hypothetical protein